MLAAGRAWLVAALCAVSAGAAAQTVPARGGLHEDFGRLVIDFPGATATEISGEGRHLELGFDRAAEIDVAAAASTLKDYIAKAGLSPDHRRLVLDFNAPVTWQAFNDGAKLALDFAFADDATQRAFDHGPDAARSRIKTAGAAEPGATAQAKPAQPEASKVRLRSGEHEGFSRLAFDWPKDVTYTIRQNGDQAELQFSAPGAIDLEKIAGDLPPRLDALSTVPASGGITVKLALKPGTVLRDFRSGNTVVLDIYDRTAANIPQPKPVAPAAVVSAAPEPAQAPSAQAQPDQELTEVPTPPMAPNPAPPKAPAPAPNPVLQTAPPQMASAIPQLQSALPEAAEAKPEPKAGVGASGPGVATPVTAQPATTFEPPRVAPPALTVKVTALPSKDSATLYFDWPKPVALAVFRRNDALWLVFDTPGKGDLKALDRVASVIGKAEPVPSTFPMPCG